MLLRTFSITLFIRLTIVFEFSIEILKRDKINKVFNQYIGEAVIEMPSGKKRRLKKELEDSQPSLFD